jgi:hypothetical protein
MSNFSRMKLFWHGTLGSNAARVATKQSQEQIQAKMARDRVVSRYKELKKNAKRGMAGTEALRKGSPNMRPGKSS